MAPRMALQMVKSRRVSFRVVSRGCPLAADVCLDLTSNYGVENPASFRTQQKRDYKEEDEEERIQKEKKKKFRFQLFSKHPLFQQIQNKKTKMKRREKENREVRRFFALSPVF